MSCHVNDYDDCDADVGRGRCLRFYDTTTKLESGDLSVFGGSTCLYWVCFGLLILEFAFLGFGFWVCLRLVQLLGSLRHSGMGYGSMEPEIPGMESQTCWH